MQIEATSRGEWVLEPEFTEPSRPGPESAHERNGALTVPDRVLVALGGALLALGAACLAALVLMLPRLYTPLF
jgi:hypothetical protein